MFGDVEPFRKVFGLNKELSEDVSRSDAIILIDKKANIKKLWGLIELGKTRLPLVVTHNVNHISRVSPRTNVASIFGFYDSNFKKYLEPPKM